MLKPLIKKGLSTVDDWVTATDLRAEPSNTLVNVLFHSLYANSAQCSDGKLAPNQSVTVSDFGAFVEEMLENRFTVVSPAQIDAGLPSGGRYLTITFDDGYFNNTQALEVLDKFRLPATFFISTDHVLQNKAFWWDAFSREMRRNGVSHSRQNSEIKRLKSWTPERIDAFLLQRFGPSALMPSGDTDRPFTPEELRRFSSNPWVHLGNHTRNHAILSNCTPSEMASQIEACQDALEDMVGYRPIGIAYPNGNYSPAAVSAASGAGLRVGFTVAPHRCRLPLDDGAQMTLGRFLFFGGQDIRRQCRLFSARFVPSYALKTLLTSGY